MLQTPAADAPSEVATSTEPQNSFFSNQAIKAAPATTAGAGSSELQPDFVKFLRNVLSGPEKEWKTVKTAGDALIRHLSVVKACDELDTLGWSRTRGGYQVPEG